MKLFLLLIIITNYLLLSDEDDYNIKFKDTTSTIGKFVSTGAYSMVIDYQNKALIVDSSLIVSKELFLNNFKNREIGFSFLGPSLYNVFVGYQRNRYKIRATLGISLVGGKINGVKEAGFFTFDLFPELAAQLEFAYQFNNSYNSKNYITAYFGVGRDILLEEKFRKDTYYFGIGYSHNYKYVDYTAYLNYRFLSTGSHSHGLNSLSGKNIGFGLRVGFFVDIF